MAALAVVEPPPGSADPVVADLDDMLTRLGGWVHDLQAGDGQVSDADRIDRIALLERLRAATAACQDAEIVAFARSQTAVQLAHDMHPSRIGRGVADQVGLACGISPWHGSRRLGVARALWFDLPHTYSALTGGEVSERIAEHIVAATRHLDAPTRRAVDAQLSSVGITGMGEREAEACARKYAYQADRHAWMTRGRTERKNRRVTLRPAPDTMSNLTGFLPIEQGVACYAALKHATDAAVAVGDPRSRGQIMADTLVQRLTGQAAAEDVNIEVHLVMRAETLLDPNDNTPADLTGHGPIPADLARHLTRTGQGQKWWRRLFTSAGPSTRAGNNILGNITSGNIVGGDPFRRRFDGWLAQLIRLRDQTCRNPYCDAPIRHTDHIRRHADGGETTLTNGRGVCQRCNQVRELPGWDVTLDHDGLGGPAHTVTITTPTGHTHQSRAPDPP
jgi:hypothetical protein